MCACVYLCDVNVEHTLIVSPFLKLSSSSAVAVKSYFPVASIMETTQRLERETMHTQSEYCNFKESNTWQSHTADIHITTSQTLTLQHNHMKKTQISQTWQFCRLLTLMPLQTHLTLCLLFGWHEGEQCWLNDYIWMNYPCLCSIGQSFYGLNLNTQWHLIQTKLCLVTTNSIFSALCLLRHHNTTSDRKLTQPMT